MNNQKTAKQFLIDNRLTFKQDELINMALTHPSYAQEHSVTNNNQRLEFLGDAVLNFVVAEYLYNNYCQKAEGELTKIRARVVCEKALVNVARRINMGDYLLLGKGEEMSGGRKRKSILADTVEAVIGAIYLDQGYDSAKHFILEHLEEFIKETASGDYYDYKSKLQEIVQAKSKENVTYTIVNESGPAHSKTFIAGVFYRERLLATGKGKSKKEAEQNAAEEVIKNSLLSDKDDF
jgi:ribonuclease-3